MINVQNLTKTFGEKEVLSGVTFEVKKQEIFALLGPSGAGKTTIINILTSSSGIAEVEARPEEIGLMLDVDGLYEHLTCLENLNLYAQIYNLPKDRPMEVLESVGLADSSKKSVSTLSRGMKQRMASLLE